MGYEATTPTMTHQGEEDIVLRGPRKFQMIQKYI
jgi:hypothetical protein